MKNIPRRNRVITGFHFTRCLRMILTSAPRPPWSGFLTRKSSNPDRSGKLSSVSKVHLRHWNACFLESDVFLTLAKRIAAEYTSIEPLAYV